MSYFFNNFKHCEIAKSLPKNVNKGGVGFCKKSHRAKKGWKKSHLESRF